MNTKLITRDNKLYLQVIKDDDEGIVEELHEVLKGYESFSGWYWFATEESCRQDSVIDDQTYPDDIIYFGLVQNGMGEDEWGYFSKAEVELLIPKLQAWEIKEYDLPFAGRRS